MVSKQGVFKFSWGQVAFIAAVAGVVIYASNNDVPFLGRSIQRGLR